MQSNRLGSGASVADCQQKLERTGAVQFRRRHNRRRRRCIQEMQNLAERMQRQAEPLQPIGVIVGGKIDAENQRRPAAVVAAGEEKRKRRPE